MINLAVLMILKILTLAVFESFCLGKGFPIKSQVLRVQTYPVIPVVQVAIWPCFYSNFLLLLNCRQNPNTGSIHEGYMDGC